MQSQWEVKLVSVPVTYLIEIPETLSIAFEVLAGKWSSGYERVKLLEDAGYNYDTVQSCVNDLCELLDKYSGDAHE